jgi:Zn-dependent protease with chaperone function
VLGIFASMIVTLFSRKPECRADQTGAERVSKQSMTNALTRLKSEYEQPSEMIVSQWRLPFVARVN